MNEFYSSCVPQLMFPDEANIIIVTGRKITFKDVTIQWLRWKGSIHRTVFHLTNKGSINSILLIYWTLKLLPV